MPELPDAKKARFMGDFGLSDYDARVLIADVASADFFEKTLEQVNRSGVVLIRTAQVMDTANPPPKLPILDAKYAANWVINDLFGRLKKDDLSIENSPVSPKQLAGLLIAVGKGDISGKIAKDLFEIVYTEGGDPAAIVAERGMKQVTDPGEIEAAVDAMIAGNPDQVAKAQANPKLAGWFVGQVLKAMGGKGNPAVVNEMVARKLGL
jgi:aspartyl-tRNA(Asn)/glutamyl-tRNA(Gln) amidotransferase subunit B